MKDKTDGITEQRLAWYEILDRCIYVRMPGADLAHAWILTPATAQSMLDDLGEAVANAHGSYTQKQPAFTSQDRDRLIEIIQDQEKQNIEQRRRMLILRQLFDAVIDASMMRVDGNCGE